MKHRLYFTATLGMAVALALASPSAALAAPLRTFTVQQFNEVVEKFVGLDVRVIGRKSLSSARELGLARCEVRFKSRRRMEILPKDVVNLQIDGRVAREGRRYVVYITNVQSLPSDVEQFEKRRRLLNKKSIDGWYELGDWAADLGQFYEDQELANLAKEAYGQGIKIERAADEAQTPATLKALSAKTEKYGLDRKLTQELMFESYVRLRDTAKTPDALERAISSAAADLPGSDKPLPEPQPDLEARYRANPVDAYEKATGVGRGYLHRMLTAELILARLQSQLDPGFENGFQIADLIDREIPEYQELAQEYRNKALQARTKQVATLSRSEVLDLKAKYETQQQPEKGREVLEAWLEQRLKRLDEQDIEGLVSLADEYVSLLNRRERAAQLLITAYDRNPKSEAISDRLRRLGYRQVNEKWHAERDIKEEEGLSDIDRAVRDGRPVPGMTLTQLRNALGEPLKIIRIATRDEVAENWFYSAGATSQLAVQLARPKGTKEAKVVAVGLVQK